MNFNVVAVLLSPFQINDEQSDKVLEIEQKYNEVRKPVYDKRHDVIKGIPDFWLTAVRKPTQSFTVSLYKHVIE